MTTLRSMTGFAAVTADDGGFRVEVQVRAVNHKQLELRLAGPSEWAAHEAAFGARVKAHVHRGRIDVRIRVDALDEAGDAEAAHVASVANRLRGVAREAGVSPEFGLAELIAAGALTASRGPAALTPDALALASETLDAAIAEFVRFRTREGAALAATFHVLLEAVSSTVETLESLRSQELEAYRCRMRERLSQLLAEGPVVGEERLAMEVALLAERSDIAEELQRARAHVGAIRELLAGEGPHGKRLDFLLQELIRETNTMASKSLSFVVTHAVVDAKTAVEQMREQAHNLE